MNIKEFYDSTNDREYLDLTFEARDEIEIKLINALYEKGMCVTPENFKDYLNLKLKSVLDEGYSPLYDVSIPNVISKHLTTDKEESQQYTNLLIKDRSKALTKEFVSLFSSYIFYKTIAGKGEDNCIKTYDSLRQDSCLNSWMIDSVIKDEELMKKIRVWLKEQISILKRLRLNRCKEDCEEVELTKNIEPATSFGKIVDSSKEKEFSSNKTLNNKRVLGETNEFCSVSKRTQVERRTIIAKIVETGVASTIRYSTTNVSNIPSIWVLDSNKNKGIHIENKYKKKFHKNEILDKTVKSLENRLNEYRELVEGKI